MTNLPKGQGELPTVFSQRELQQKADRIYNIAQAGTVNNIVNYGPVRKPLSPNEYYNLFIIRGEKYERDSFFLETNRSFEYTNTAIWSRFGELGSGLTLDDIDEITSLPTLFLPEAYDSNHDIKIGYLGKLEDVNIMNRYTKFKFLKEHKIYLNLVVLHHTDLNIEDEWELSRTHWAIKRANLKQIIKEITNGDETE